MGRYCQVTCWDVRWEAWTGILPHTCCPSAADAEHCWVHRRCMLCGRTPEFIRDEITENVTHMKSTGSLLSYNYRKLYGTLRSQFVPPRGQPSWPPDCCGRRSWAEHQRWRFLKGWVSREEKFTNIHLNQFDRVTTDTTSHNHLLYCLPAGSRCRTGARTYQ